MVAHGVPFVNTFFLIFFLFFPGAAGIMPAMKKNTRMHIVLDNSAADDLRASARARGLSMSALARAVIVDFLRAETGRGYSAVKHGGRHERRTPPAAEKE